MMGEEKESSNYKLDGILAPQAASAPPTADDDVENNIPEERPTTASDSYKVYWDEPVDHDPTNPMNWTTARKTSIIATVSFVSFLT